MIKLCAEPNIEQGNGRTSGCVAYLWSKRPVVERSHNKCPIRNVQIFDPLFHIDALFCRQRRVGECPCQRVSSWTKTPKVRDQQEVRCIKLGKTYDIAFSTVVDFWTKSLRRQ